MLARPRLIVYNASLADVRTALAEVAARLDPEHRWAGDGLYLPQLGVQLHLDGFGPLRNVTLEGTGVRNSFFGWRHLRKELQQTLRGTEVRPNLYGLAMLAVGCTLLAFPLTLVALNGAKFNEQLAAFLRM